MDERIAIRVGKGEEMRKEQWEREGKREGDRRNRCRKDKGQSKEETRMR
jgi:hypothetical protein